MNTYKNKTRADSNEKINSYINNATNKYKKKSDREILVVEETTIILPKRTRTSFSKQKVGLKLENEVPARQGQPHVKKDTYATKFETAINKLFEANNMLSQTVTRQNTLLDKYTNLINGQEKTIIDQKSTLENYEKQLNNNHETPLQAHENTLFKHEAIYGGISYFIVRSFESTLINLPFELRTTEIVSTFCLYFIVKKVGEILALNEILNAIINKITTSGNNFFKACIVLIPSLAIAAAVFKPELAKAYALNLSMRFIQDNQIDLLANNPYVLYGLYFFLGLMAILAVKTVANKFTSTQPPIVNTLNKG